MNSRNCPRKILAFALLKSSSRFQFEATLIRLTTNPPLTPLRRGTRQARQQVCPPPLEGMEVGSQALSIKTGLANAWVPAASTRQLCKHSPPSRQTRCEKSPDGTVNCWWTHTRHGANC